MMPMLYLEPDTALGQQHEQQSIEKKMPIVLVYFFWKVIPVSNWMILFLAEPSLFLARKLFLAEVPVFLAMRDIVLPEIPSFYAIEKGSILFPIAISLFLEILVTGPLLISGQGFTISGGGGSKLNSLSLLSRHLKHVS